MSKWVDLVIVRQGDTNKLFIAPGFSYLGNGDEVICDTCRGDQPGTVVATLSREEGDGVYSFVKEMIGNKPLRKILRKVTYSDLTWQEDSDE